MAYVTRKKFERRGIATLEMAIVLLALLLPLTCGIVEYGWLFLKQGYVTNAARHGARVGARVDATLTDVQNAVQTAMANGGMPTEGTHFTVSVTPDPSGLAGGASLTVTVTANYSPGVSLNMPLVPKPATLTSTVVMAKEG